MKKYMFVRTTSVVGSGFAGLMAVEAGDSGPAAVAELLFRTGAKTLVHSRAEAAAEAAFRTTGAFPGVREMGVLVRVDGGRAVVCASRGRYGW